MEKIFSTRLDESTIKYIGLLANQLGTSKKAIVEKAIRFFGKQVSDINNINVFKQTCGAWKRDEPVDKTIENVRKTFQNSMIRHKK